MVLSENFKRVFVTEAAKPFQKTVAVVAGSFKPPTAAHWDMVEKYAEMADKVVVIVSNPQKANSIRKTATGQAISAEQSKEVFETYAKRYGLAGKVEVVVSPLPSPVSAAYSYIDSLSGVNVVLGVSKKGGDEARFAKTKARYADKTEIYMVDPLESAVDPYVSPNGIPMSATDARAAMADPEAFEKYLPAKLSPADVQRVEAILGVGAASEADVEESRMAPLAETEEFHIDIDDSMLSQAKASAWNAGVVAKDEKGKDVPVNPKKFPERAVRVAFVCEPAAIEIFLDGKTCQWDSDVDFQGQQLKLSPDQMGSFFRTSFFQHLRAKLRSDWPLSDEKYSKLFQAVDNPEMAIPRAPAAAVLEDGKDDETVTASGRKIAHFSDQSINVGSVQIQCWPRWNHEFSLGQWKNWEYLGNLCKLSFKHSNGHEYNVAVSPLAEDYDLRGFRGYDVTQQPPVQWLTKNELAEVQKLTIFQKFCHKCTKRILHYAKMDPEEVAKKVGKPKRPSAEDVASLQKIMRRTAQEVVANKQMDTFRWK